MFAYEKLINHRIETRSQYSMRDTILYALGVGAGIDAVTPAQLSYVYEDGLQALPTMAVVLASPGFWLKEPQFKVDWQKVLHGEQSLEIHHPLPVEGDIQSVLTIDTILDKGRERGAVLYSSRQLYDAATGAHYATLRQSSFLRGDGGTGGSTEPSPKPHAVSADRPADVIVTLATRPEQALIYRLCGDYNPLHADPAIAARAGFDRPILHGLATFGIVGRALLNAICDDVGVRMKRIDARFSSVVYPGESIRTEIWKDSDKQASFRAAVVERDTIVVNNGYAEIS